MLTQIFGPNNPGRIRRVHMGSCFEPVIWPEDKLPKEATGYIECEICTEKSRVIWGREIPTHLLL